MPEGESFTVEDAASTWFEDGDWSEAAIPARSWIASGYFLRGAITLVVGPGGVSKSTLMNAYAVALALGIDLHGMRPNGPARSLLFNAEDDAHEQQRRLSAVLTSMGREPAHIRQGGAGRAAPDRHAAGPGS